jgi:hypothetical protein
MYHTRRTPAAEWLRSLRSIFSGIFSRLMISTARILLPGQTPFTLNYDRTRPYQQGQLHKAFGSGIMADSTAKTEESAVSNEKLTQGHIQWRAPILLPEA